MANKTSAQQMNVRIEPLLKSEGDSVFESLGLSPSQAVRALYETAVRHRYDTSPLISFLLGDSDRIKTASTQENTKLDIANAGREAMDVALKNLGISKQSLCECSSISDEDLLEEATYTRLVERDLL